jgi:hypothetical protein
MKCVKDILDVSIPQAKLTQQFSGSKEPAGKKPQGLPIHVNLTHPPPPSLTPPKANKSITPPVTLQQAPPLNLPQVPPPINQAPPLVSLPLNLQQGPPPLGPRSHAPKEGTLFKVLTVTLFILKAYQIYLGAKF